MRLVLPRVRSKGSINVNVQAAELGCRLRLYMSNNLKSHFQVVDTISVDWNAKTLTVLSQGEETLESATRPTTILQQPKAADTTKNIGFRGGNWVTDEAAVIPLFTRFLKRAGGARCRHTLYGMKCVLSVQDVPRGRA